MGVLILRTAVQKSLFDIEIRGQLSDGHWENAGPGGHWEFWTRCKTIVGMTPGYIGNPKRTNYRLTSKKLLEIIGSRMVVIARLTLQFGIEDAARLFNLFDLRGNFYGPYDFMRQAAYIRVYGNPDDYTEEQLAKIKEAGENESLYGKKNLMADLREIMAAMATRID